MIRTIIFAGTGLMALAATPAAAMVQGPPPEEPAAVAAAPASTQGCSLNARQVVERFIPLFYEQRNAKLAFETWVHPDYIQHNPGAPSGRDAAVNFLQPFFDSNPQARYTVHRVVASDGLVAVHNEARFSPDAPASAVVDIYRVSQCKIVEHWDVIQPVPASSVNGHDMFGTVEIRTTGKRSEPCILSTRQVADGFVPLLYGQSKVREAYEKWVHPDYKQHNPNAQNGRDAAIAFLEPIFQRNPQHQMTVYRVIVEDDMIAVHLVGRASPEDRGAVAVDFLRVDNCKIVEHWDVTQSVPERAMNDNGMF